MHDKNNSGKARKNCIGLLAAHPPCDQLVGENPLIEFSRRSPDVNLMTIKPK